ncbi:hypothetical protein L6475_02080 [Prevotella sp. E9-3]|uniref:hypothetical protein n=1 Tax=Prevotella sp. E9-3 TaxID=2913621 RepID=UPI001EDBEC8F|nr:hypothetical protein [Prevotella sp. E9-3]UKK48783.1 hypothetical protein L6475_02080 [Prevotella sp. E9-3]
MLKTSKLRIMKQNTKDWIHYVSAIVLIASAVTLAFLSFLLTRDIGAGPLTYIGEALSAALGIFGFGIYIVNKMGDFKTEIRNELSRIKDEERRGRDGQE